MLVAFFSLSLFPYPFSLFMMMHGAMSVPHLSRRAIHHHDSLVHAIRRTGLGLGLGMGMGRTGPTGCPGNTDYGLYGQSKF